MTPNEWVVGSDTGRSSKTIWAVMMGVITEPVQCGYGYDVPSDPADFGRCYRLLELFPEWINRLGDIARLLPAWKPLIENWGALTDLYKRDIKSGYSTELYDKMQPLIEEGKILDGWKRTGAGCWTRGKSQIIKLGSGVSISS